MLKFRLPNLYDCLREFCKTLKKLEVLSVRRKSWIRNPVKSNFLKHMWNFAAVISLSHRWDFYEFETLYAAIFVPSASPFFNNHTRIKRIKGCLRKVESFNFCSEILATFFYGPEKCLRYPTDAHKLEVFLLPFFRCKSVFLHPFLLRPKAVNKFYIR